MVDFVQFTTVFVQYKKLIVSFEDTCQSILITDWPAISTYCNNNTLKYSDYLR